jgi:hypothetical protein
MEDLRIWFLESRIRLLWSGISDKSWSDFLTDESGKNRKALKDLLDGSTGAEKVRICAEHCHPAREDKDLLDRGTESE